MQFDWLIARQSKCDIRNGMDRAFERVFEFSVQETSKDLPQNGKHIVLKPEPKKLPLESSP